MDVVRMIEALRDERDRIDEAIAVLQRMATGTSRPRRGRPPKSITAETPPPAETPKRKRRTLSAEARKRIADAQRKRWAAKRPKASE